MRTLDLLGSNNIFFRTLTSNVRITVHLDIGWNDALMPLMLLIWMILDMDYDQDQLSDLSKAYCSSFCFIIHSFIIHKWSKTCNYVSYIKFVCLLFSWHSQGIFSGTLKRFVRFIKKLLQSWCTIIHDSNPESPVFVICAIYKITNFCCI